MDSDFHPNDEDDNEEFHLARAQVVAGMAQKLSERAAAELGLYAKADLPIQQIPGTDQWAVQFVFQVGNRAYAKLKDVDDSFELLRNLELEMIRDDLMDEDDDADS